MHKFKNKQLSTVILIIGIVLSYLILSTEFFHSLVIRLTPFAYIAELAAGALYTSFVTIPVSLSMLSVLAEDTNIYTAAIIGGFGALIVDSILLRAVNRTGEAIKPPKKFKKFRDKFSGKLLFSILGVSALASPVPDEVALSLLGVSKISWGVFIVIVYPIKVLGIFLVLLSLRTMT